jgi:pimeloyl-ACP methyl ester carboxylesterase
MEQRAALELVDLFSSPVYYGVGVPRGDGSPVLLLPGFLGSDDYLVILRGWLRRVGYRPHASDIGLCVGPLPELTDWVLQRAVAVATKAGRRVTLIGHSLGGALACLAAQRRPDVVAHVVTLGTARRPETREATHPVMKELAERLLWNHSPPTAQALVRDGFSAPLPRSVRLTCIYSRDDAVVDWRACIDSDPRTSLHEVRGTHTGLAWNPATYHALGRSLATTAIPG